MVQFTVTNELKEQLKHLPKQEFDALVSSETLSHEKLTNVYKRFKPTPSLLDLIKCSQMIIPNKNVVESKPKTKEYIKLMERLRNEQKEKEYKDLIKPKQQFETLYEDNGEEIITPAQMNKELKNNLTTIVNILISVGSVVYAIWYWTETSWGLANSYRVLLCLFFGILVLVAEVVVYLGYLNKIDTARKVERNKKEVKKLIKTL